MGQLSFQEAGKGYMLKEPRRRNPEGKRPRRRQAIDKLVGPGDDRLGKDRN